MSQVTKCDICGAVDKNGDWLLSGLSTNYRITTTVKRRWSRDTTFEDVDICPDCLRALRNKRKEQ